MNSITRRFSFDAGHRVLGHESKCAKLHGHLYIAEVTIETPDQETLDKLGRVIDFSVIKQVIGGWIDTNWDHNFIGHKDDPILTGIILPSCNNLSKMDLTVLHGHDAPYVMVHGNPTAENMARELLEISQNLLSIEALKNSGSGRGLLIREVVIHETPNCRARYKPREWDYFYKDVESKTGPFKYEE